MFRLWFSLLILGAASVATADYLEVRRSANIYEDSSRHSSVLGHVAPPTDGGRTILQLLQDDRQNGYYRVRVPGTSDPGWIYKTLVRRFPDQEGAFVAYKRSLYRHWIDADRDCQDTRAEVLIRDDDNGVVEFKTDDECSVESGTWADPYTGDTFTGRTEVDVDHFVPLKNAHISGAWAWSKQRRREYANFMGNPVHLLAVSASENRRKGSRGPDRYLPPNTAYHCDYVRIWLQIKADWDLVVSDSERETIEAVLENCP